MFLKKIISFFVSKDESLANAHKLYLFKDEQTTKGVALPTEEEWCKYVKKINVYYIENVLNNALNKNVASSLLDRDVKLGTGTLKDISNKLNSAIERSNNNSITLKDLLIGIIGTAIGSFLMELIEFLVKK